MQSPVALQAQKFRSCMCADEMYAPIFAPNRDDVACGPMLHDRNCRVTVRRVPSARPVVVVPQDVIHDVCLVVELSEQTHPKHDARVVVLHGTQHSGTLHATVARSAASCGSILRRAPRARVRAAAADAWCDSRCTSGSSPGSSRALAGHANSALAGHANSALRIVTKMDFITKFCRVSPPFPWVP